MASKRTVKIKNIVIGGGNPVAIQSMLNVDTADKADALRQTRELKEAGCGIVRLAIRNMDDIDTIRYINDHLDVALVADIQFDYRLAIESVRAGIHKIRYNPGNIGDPARAMLLADICMDKGVPVRIGVNGGSLDKSIKSDGGVSAYNLYRSIKKHVDILENCGFSNIVLSAKSSSVMRTVETYRMLSKEFEYPLHIGVTESGSLRGGLLKSAIGIGALLCDGIGDTVRVSLTADPVTEVDRARAILRAVGMDSGYVEVISCPTCARCMLPLESLVANVEDYVRNIKTPLKIAIMGCAVNGPGEASEADFGIAGGGNGTGVIFEKGSIVKTVPVEELLPELIALIDKYSGE